MYINNFLCSYGIKKDESKSGRIFRPWDSKSAETKSKDNSQDSTVSTTTQEGEDIIGISEKKNQKTSVYNCKIEDKQNAEAKSILNTMNSSSQNFTTDSFLTSNSNITASNLYERGCLDKLSNSPTQLQPNLQLPDPSLYHQEQDQKHIVNPDIILQSSPLPLDFIQDPYNPLYPDLMQTNLAQHLGLSPNDPLILESIAQGYALEEYTRVLSQEQHAKLLAAKKQRPKKYKCPHCDVGFSNNGQLKGHIRIHTGERPFKCDDKDCGKTFTRNEELTRHKRIHSGLRPFPCTHCGKRFGRKDHLKKHSRTHFQPRGLYAVPVVLPFEAWASGQTNGYPFFPVMY